MHGWGDSEIPAFALALFLVVLVSLGFAAQVTARSKRKHQQQRRSNNNNNSNSNNHHQQQRSLVIESGGSEGLSASSSNNPGAQSKIEYRSMLATSSRICAICENPTSRRCSRCKSVRYCSSECQARHWNEGHKNECRAPEPATVSDIAIMCNGQLPEKSKIVNGAKLLDRSSSGASSSDGTDNLSEDNLVSKQSPKPQSNHVSSDGSLARPKKLLFPYDTFIKLFNWDCLELPCGLINCGNSCFANVVLQCLTYTRPVAAYLLEGGHSEDCKRDDWCFMCELQSHLWKVRQSHNPFSPIRILSRIRNIGNHLGYGRQEDAHEFMRFAIDSMQSICLDEVGGEKAFDTPTKETTLIHHIFGGYLQSQVKCMQCQHESNRYESMMDLAVEIHGVVESLEDAISQFTTTEMLDGENKYKCDRCNAYVRARKRLTVHEAPNILTIALKRFQSGKFGKLNKRVTYPEVLDMSPYMSGKGDKPPLYKLYAVVVHVDLLNASFFGHYICYVKDSNGVWYKIDDNKVNEVELDKVMAQRAYMLFYSRSVARNAPVTEEQPNALPSAAIATLSNLNRLSSLESQRSSIILPKSGAIPAPTDLCRDHSTNMELVAVEANGVGNRVIDQDQPQRPDYGSNAAHYKVGASFATKDTDMEPSSTNVSEEVQLSVESNSYERLLNSLSGTSALPGCTFSSQTGGSISSLLGNNDEDYDLFLDSPSDGPDRGGAKRLHDDCLSLPLPRPLDIAQLPMFPLEEGGGRSSPCSSPVLDSWRTSSSRAEWTDGDVDLVSSKFFSSVPSQELAVSNLSTVESDGQQQSAESDLWTDEPSARAKRQHIENFPERLRPVGSGDCETMEIDEGSECVDNIMLSDTACEVVPDDFARSVPVPLDSQGDNHHGGSYSPPSSKALLDLESVCSTSIDQHDNDFIPGKSLSSSLRFPRVSVDSFLAESTSGGGSFPVSELLYHNRKLIEELPGPLTEGIENGQIHLTEAYDDVLLDDDTPYVVVKPISTQPGVYDFGEEDEYNFEASVSDMEEGIDEEPADDAVASVKEVFSRISDMEEARNNDPNGGTSSCVKPLPNSSDMEEACNDHDGGALSIVKPSLNFLDMEEIISEPTGESASSVEPLVNSSDMEGAYSKRTEEAVSSNVKPSVDSSDMQEAVSNGGGSSSVKPLVNSSDMEEAVSNGRGSSSVKPLVNSSDMEEAVSNGRGSSSVKPLLNSSDMEEAVSNGRGSLCVKSSLNSSGLQEVVEESVAGAKLGVANSPQKSSQEITQEELSLAAASVKAKAQTPKPLFAQGFLNKSPRLRSVKSSNSSTIANSNGVGDSNGKVHRKETEQNSPAGKSANEIVANVKEVVDTTSIGNGRLSSPITSNGNHSNGKSVSIKKSSVPLESTRENGVPSTLLVDRSGGMKLKQGRNESCACGSQQKWKKCCGKASVLKGGLATKQVTV